MGNRATVIFTDGKKNHSAAIYLHWNGGPESIYGFLQELDRRKIRADQDYEAARFIQLIGEFFDQDSIGGLSLGVANGPKEITAKCLDKVRTDHSDNGFYIVNRVAMPMSMRRFTEKRFDDPGSEYGYKYELSEWSEDEVAREKDEALKSYYIPDFKEFYAKLTEGKEIREH